MDEKDDKDQLNPQAQDEGAAEPAPASAADADEGGQSGKSEDRAARMSAAKAFYRAMYAGEEVNPDDYGISLSNQQSSEPRDCQSCKALAQQLQEAEAKTQEAESIYKRLAADFENYRKRVDREREEFGIMGQMRAVEALLPALDDLDRAQSSLTSVTDPKVILDSIDLIARRFAGCLEALGAKGMQVVGEPFDPRLHEPVQEIRTNDFPESTVVHELRRGYSFKDKVLRPALVNVSTRLSDEEAEAQAAAQPETAARPETAAQPETAAEAAQPQEPQTQEAPPPAPQETAQAVEAQPVAPADEGSQPEARASADSQTVDKALQNLVQPQRNSEKAEKHRPTAQELTKDLHSKTTSTQDLPVIDIDERLLEGEIEESRSEPPAREEGQVYEIDGSEASQEYAETSSKQATDD